MLQSSLINWINTFNLEGDFFSQVKKPVSVAHRLLSILVPTSTWMTSMLPGLERAHLFLVPHLSRAIDLLRTGLAYRTFALSILHPGL